MDTTNVFYRTKRKYKYFKAHSYNRRKNKFLNDIGSEKKFIILGNQKTGSTAIAALLAARSNKSVMLDIKDAIPDVSWQLNNKYQVGDFSDFIYKYKNDFKKDIIKEPSLTFFNEELHKYFPNADYMFIVRNPFDNIRSILNRLQIPGNLSHINFSDWNELNCYPIWRLALDSTWLGQPKGNYVEALAYRWCVASNVYLQSPNDMFLLRYEDFVSNKIGSIDRICSDFNFPMLCDISQLQDRQYQGKGIGQVDPVDFFGVDNFKKIKDICADKALEFGYEL